MSRSCPDCGTRWNPPLRGRYVGTVLGANEKIGTVSADLPAGPPRVGGSCLMTTPGCRTCYAQSLENVFNAENALLGKHERAFAILRANADDYRDAVVGELEAYEARTGRTLDPVRIHAFGDFFSADHILAWVGIAKALPRTRFFGTTRTWRAFLATVGPTVAMQKPLDRLRKLPNVFLGASLDHATRWKPVPARLGGQSAVDWLHANGWTVWNALSEFSDGATRAAAGAELFRSKAGESVADVHAKARGQFAAARRMGRMMVGVGCMEQTGAKPHCEACNHCLHKSDGTSRWDVTFAYHPGTEKSVERHGHRSVEA